LEVIHSIVVCTEKCVQDLLRALTCQPLAPLQHLENKQALAKQFAEIMHFTLKFDDLKVMSSRNMHDRESVCLLVDWI